MSLPIAADRKSHAQLPDVPVLIAVYANETNSGIEAIDSQKYKSFIIVFGCMFVVLYANDCMKRELTVKKISQMVSADINCFESGGSWCGKMYHKPIQTSQILLVKTPGEKMFSLEQM